MNLSEDMDKWIERKETNAYRQFHYLNTSGYKTFYSAHTWLKIKTRFTELSHKSFLLKIHCLFRPV